MSTTDRPRVRLVLAEDQGLLREALEPQLSRVAGLDVLGAAEDLDGLVPLVRRHAPDVAVVDLYMPAGVPAGFEAPRRLRAISPTLRLLALADDPLPADLARAFDAGFDGYSTKNISVRLLGERVRAVAAGRAVVDPSVSAAVIDRDGSLLGRKELILLGILATGGSRSMAAERLGISERQLRRIANQACRALRAETITQAVAEAARRGLV